MRGDVLAAFCAPPIAQGMMHVPFYECVLQTLSYDSQHNRRLAGVLSNVHGYIPEARTGVVRAFLEGECEWLWFLDYDMIFNPDSLDKLLGVAEGGPERLDIVGALYFNHIEVEDETMILPTWLKDVDGIESVPMYEVELKSLVDVATVGMGCTLIHRSVFEKMAANRPDDAWPWYAHDQIVSETGKRLTAGEDVTFCRRARADGFRIWGYSGVVCDHIKTHRIGIRAFLDQSEPTKRRPHDAGPVSVDQGPQGAP